MTEQLNIDHEPKVKMCGRYHSIPDIVKLYGIIKLKYIPSNNSIQVRDEEDRWIGNVKYDYSCANKEE